MRSLIAILVGLALLVQTGPLCAQDYAIDSFFDVFTELTVGPPYPSEPPVRIGAFGDEMHLEDILLQIGNKSTNPQDWLEILASDSGGPEGPGDKATLEIFVPDGDFAVDSFFDITYRIDLSPPDVQVEKVDLPSGDFAVDSFFDITYQIEFPDGRQELRGVRGILSSDQPAITRIGGSVVPSSDFQVDSFFDIFFEIEVEGTVPIDPGIPLLRVDMDGGHTPEPSTFALLGMGAVGLAVCGWRKRRRR